MSDRKAVRESLYSYAKTGKPSSTNAINEYFGKPSGKSKADEDASVLMQLYNATNGGFGFADALDAYGKRARKLRTEAFDTLDSSVQPGIDPFVGAGRKALGTVQFLAHPFMALAPSPDEMQQRAIDAGNPEWAGVGWSLGNLVNLPSPSDSATVLATLGKGMAAAKAATPIVPAMFIGAAAKTFPHDKVMAAEKLESLGHTGSDIRDMTGLFRGADGKWRAEISDAGSTMTRDLNNLPGGSRPLGDVLSHDELYRAYPSLRYAEVNNSGDASGRYISRDNSDVGRVQIYAGGATPEEQRSVLLHEIMHGVQDIEGFAPGASYGANQPDWDRYFRSAGEVEARNVQSRADLTAADLAEDYNGPWFTQDIQYGQQIVRPSYGAARRK